MERSEPRSSLLKALGTGLLVFVALGAAFWLGVRVGVVSGGSRKPAPPSTTEARVDHWTCPMHPEVRQAQPGSCPICGMELVPVRAETEAPVKKAKYACAMMCVPPQDRAGKCPVCGMEMVPVEEAGDDKADNITTSTQLSELTLSPQAQRLAKLQVAEVERRFVATEIRMVGKVAFDETRMRTISSRVAGRLDRLYVDYTGVPVKKGDHLVSLYSPDLLAAQQELIQAVNAATQLDAGAPQERRRMRLDTLEAARQKLVLWGLMPEQLREIEERGSASDHLTIYAPIGGIVVDKRVVEGAYVETGTEIYTLADLTHLWVKLDAYETDLAWLRYGQEVEFTTEAYEGERFHGTIAFIDPVLNARTRTAKVRVNVPNMEGRLKPEMFVRAMVRARLTAEGKVIETSLAGKWVCPMHPEVIRDGPDDCTQCGMPLVTAESLGYASQAPSESRAPLVIPATAPLITGLRAIVYVARLDRPGRYEGREVTLGPRAGDYYLVYDGLSEGDFVVLHGTLYLDSAVQILAKRSMMQPQPAGTPGEDSHGAAARPAVSVHSLPSPAQQMLERGLDAYFAVHRALVHDQLAAAQQAAGSFTSVTTPIGDDGLPEAVRADWQSLATDLVKSMGGIASAQTIDSARASFEGASLALTAMAKRFGTGTRHRLFVYHCPMAFDNRGASWLQDVEGLENPYFGAAMLTCGLRTEVIEKASPAGSSGGSRR